MSAVSIYRSSKTLVIEGTAYPLSYGLCCPITHEPVMTITSLIENKAAVIVKPEIKTTVGGMTGFVIRRSFQNYYISRLTQKRRAVISAIYFYGLKEDFLLKKAFEFRDSELKLPYSEFKEAILAGKLGSYKIGRELVIGNDLIVVYSKGN